VTVSVIIPVYNVAEIVDRAIRSALDQTVKPLEIIVVDDRSTDDTIAVVKKIDSPLVRVVSAPSNRGPAAARNLGIAKAKGDWIALLDADDAWLPERLERLLAVGESGAADFVADNIVLWDLVAGKQVRVAIDDLEPAQQITATDLFEHDHDFEFRIFSWGLLKPILRKSFLDSKGLRYEQTMRSGEDFTLYAEMLLSGAKAFLISDAYYLYSLPSAPSGRSPHSRSKHDFSVVIAMSDVLREKYKDRIDARLAAAMARRRKTWTLIHEANVARGYRRSNLAQYAWYVGTKPDLVRALFGRVLGRAQDRLRLSTRQPRAPSTAQRLALLQSRRTLV